jgi:hypothetical protein
VHVLPDHSVQAKDELVKLVSLIDRCKAKFQVHGGENGGREELEKVAKGKQSCTSQADLGLLRVKSVQSRKLH